MQTRAYKQPKRRADSYAHHGIVNPQTSRRAFRLVWEPSGDFEVGMLFSLSEMSYGLRASNFADGAVFMLDHKRLVVRKGFLHDTAGQVVLAIKSLGR